MRKILWMLALVWVACLDVSAVEIGMDVQNRFGMIGVANIQQETQQLDFVWVPDVTLRSGLGADYALQGEFSAWAKLSNRWQDGGYENGMDAAAYRWWLRLSNTQTELKAGLQRLNFGSAVMLRPLQWFDQINPLDPNEETKGVRALMIRHNFVNNSNFWLWCMLGEDTAKGNEMLPGVKDKPEFGGRVQIPNPIGESGISAHYRQLNTGDEYRVGLDHRYDGPVGAWLEASGSYYDDAAGGALRYMAAATLGMDYTFGIGNGMAMTLEHMALAGSKGSLGDLHNLSTYTTVTLNYPLGLLDSAIVYATHDWKQKRNNLAVIWRRVYDYLSWNLSLAIDSGWPAALSNSPTIGITIDYDI